MFAYAAAFDSAEPYARFLDRYATPEQRRRWDEFHASITLTPAQTALLESFVRDMRVLVMAGAWCGDCINQCPIFERFAAVSPRIQVRYIDRDADPAVTDELMTCGGARVPAVVFLSEDGLFCGRAGDRTLSKYRSLVQNLGGASCSTGLAPADGLTAAVIQDWLDEFERVQWMLRTSSRLRQLHGD